MRPPEFPYSSGSRPPEELEAAIAEWARLVVQAINGGLELPDLDTRGRRLAGNLDTELVEVEFAQSGLEVRLPHSFDREIRNILPLLPPQPVVFSIGATSSTDSSVYVRAFTPTGVTVVYPFKSRFLLWGMRPERRS